MPIMNKKICIGLTGESVSPVSEYESILIKNLHNESDLFSFYSSVDSETLIFIVQDISHASYRSEIFKKCIKFCIVSGLPVLLVQVFLNSDDELSSHRDNSGEMRLDGQSIPTLMLSRKYMERACPGNPLLILINAIRSLITDYDAFSYSTHLIKEIFSPGAKISLNYINNMGLKYSLGISENLPCDKLVVTLVQSGDESLVTCEERVLEHSPGNMKTIWNAAICRRINGIESYGWYIST